MVSSSVQAIWVKIREVFRIRICGSSALRDDEGEVCITHGKISDDCYSSMEIWL
jgi:hypothetical protein